MMSSANMSGISDPFVAAEITHQEAMRIAKQDDVATLRKLIQADPGIVKKVFDNYYGYSLLHFALGTPFNAPNVFDELLEHGADVNAIAEGTGDSPLRRTVRNLQSFSMTKKLIEKGADVNLITEGATPLQLACLYGNLETVELLLEHGADPNLHPDPERYHHTLKLAAIKWGGESEGVRLILRFLIEKKGGTSAAFSVAELISSDPEQWVKWLLEKYADWLRTHPEVLIVLLAKEDTAGFQKLLTEYSQEAILELRCSEELATLLPTVGIYYCAKNAEARGTLLHYMKNLKQWNILKHYQGIESIFDIPDASGLPLMHALIRRVFSVSSREKYLPEYRAVFELISALFKEKNIVNTVTAGTHWTPLHFLYTANGDGSVCPIRNRAELLTRIPLGDIPTQVLNKQDRQGNTVAHYAMMCATSWSLASHSLPQLLLEAGADFLVRNADGKRPIDVCYASFWHSRFAQVESFASFVKKHIDPSSPSWEAFDEVIPAQKAARLAKIQARAEEVDRSLISFPEEALYLVTCSEAGENELEMYAPWAVWGDDRNYNDPKVYRTEQLTRNYFSNLGHATDIPPATEEVIRAAIDVCMNVWRDQKFPKLRTEADADWVPFLAISKDPAIRLFGPEEGGALTSSQIEETYKAIKQTLFRVIGCGDHLQDVVTVFPRTSNLPAAPSATSNNADKKPKKGTKRKVSSSLQENDEPPSSAAASVGPSEKLSSDPEPRHYIKRLGSPFESKVSGCQFLFSLTFIFDDREDPNTYPVILGGVFAPGVIIGIMSYEVCT